MSFELIHELPQCHVDQSQATRTFYFSSCDGGIINDLATLYEHDAVPQLQSAYPGLPALRCEGYRVINPDLDHPHIYKLIAYYQRYEPKNNEASTDISNLLYGDCKPWERPWQWKIDSISVKQTTYARYNPNLRKMEPHVNTAGDFFMKPIVTDQCNDLITLKKNFFTPPSTAVFSARGKTNEGSITICGRSGSTGQFLLRRCCIEQKYLITNELHKEPTPYYAMELQIEFSDIPVMSSDRTLKGFYFSIPSTGSRELKNIDASQMLTQILLPLRDFEGKIKEDNQGNTLSESVDDWCLDKNGVAIHGVNSSQHTDKYLMGPYLAQAPVSWSFVASLRIPNRI